MYLIDSHCHLNFDGLSSRLPEVFANMEANHVKQALAISVSRQSFSEVLAIAEANEHIFATVGIHPDDKDTPEFTVEELVAHAQHPKVVGIGETGLDYYWCKGDLGWQHQRFADHIEAANQSGLPLVVHTRDAAADTMRLLREHQAHAGVIHCFTEDVAVAKEALDLGFYISFSGIVTFKNAPDIQAAAKYVPQDRILIETDSPFLAPVPKRGKPNEPAYVKYTAEFVAGLRGDTVEHIAEITTDNFYRLFNKVPRLAETPQSV
ncbi:TatD family hydrolase [Neisseria zalophi]|uniref:TatD family deoxyribonuclease n=1 Tax=Neisseria zalophi TaxID=640030 RepID=A0A5J6PWM7_9NEIS|nr:TatD family hydrolase [Neisseria zalophi]QEY27218.1 TatD family deoxyribonuclease [Neisseria zalophi]